MKGYNKDIKDEQIDALIIACALISAKLYHYIDIEEDGEYVHDRSEGELINWQIAIYRDKLDWNEVILLEQEVITSLHDRIYVSRSVFTDTNDSGIRDNYVSLLAYSDYIEYTGQERMVYCRQNAEPNKYSFRILTLI